MAALSATDVVLVPMTQAFAPAMAEVLADPEIHRFLDASVPPSVEHLTTYYARLESRLSPDRTQRWLNWIVCLEDGKPIGYVQATVHSAHDAWIAYVLSPRHWGQGLAFQAIQAMIRHLSTAYGISHFFASVDCENLRSIALLERLGFSIADDSERARHSVSPQDRLYLSTFDVDQPVPSS